MSIRDVIKESVLESLRMGDLFVSDIVMALVFSSLLGIYVYFLYQFAAKNELNNRDFHQTLALLPLITTSILLAMQSNLVVSLGMVGALSIVRYRTAVKNPMDLAFLFLSISVGIITGTGIYKLAILAVVFFTVMLFVVNCMPAMVCMVLKWNMPYSSVTPTELRQKSRRNGGWHMGIVHDQLEDYGVLYTTAEPTRNNIVKALDEGKLVLCQFNAWDLDVSGHCYVIVGYRRQGGALWFCVEDPEGEEMGKYGRPANDQAWLEAEDALWSITRFVDEITLVDPESAEITNE